MNAANGVRPLMKQLSAVAARHGCAVLLVGHMNKGGGEAYREDVAEINEQLTEIRTDFGKLLSLLTEIADPKPGKRFVPPPTVRDLPGYAEPAATEEAV